MKRRDFLRLIGAAGVTGAFPGMLIKSAAAAEAAPFQGVALITIAAGGGWDHSSFCDPRENPDINRWANNNPAGAAGNLRYAPFAENAELFDKYSDRMLVINGIDLQSNGHGGASLSHTTGGLSGYPVLNAVYGAIHGAGLPMPWLHASGQTQHLGVLPFTRLPSATEMRTLADPNRRDGDRLYLRSSDAEIIERYRVQRLQAQLQQAGMPYAQAQLATQYDARTNRGLMDQLSDALPDVIDTVDLKGTNSGMVSEIHRFLVAVQAGICVTANVSTGGFDTHSNHDARHAAALTRLTRAVDYLWTKAEEIGIADRILVHLTSDVGRTPRYNGNNGKDHWSNGSSVLMMKGQPWTNRVVGLSGPAHQKVNIDPATLQEDANGERLRMPHVHRALRRVLGIENDPICQQYDFGAPEIDLLNPSNQSPVNV